MAEKLKIPNTKLIAKEKSILEESGAWIVDLYFGKFYSKMV